jgi:hypothetical protein
MARSLSLLEAKAYKVGRCSSVREPNVALFTRVKWDLVLLTR